MTAESDLIERALGEALGNGHVVSGWVLAATYFDPDGEHRVWIETAPGTLHTNVLGLLDYTTQHIHRVMFRDDDV